jgi:DNA-binding winged helix-turn-helix (wHTH) protein
MVLSRSACMLIRVYAPQVAAAQPAATTRSELADAGARIETVRRVGYRIVAS